MAKAQSEAKRRRIVNTNDVTCSTCQAKLKKGWKNIRAHTLSAHGREPYFDREGRYPNNGVMLAAYAGAFPELMMSA